MLRTHLAFTLVELLVAMGILAVLAAVLFPLGKQAIERSSVENCAQNLRTQWLAIEMYRADYESRSEVGTPAQMGLPVGDWVETYKLDQNLKCRRMSELPQPWQTYRYQPGGSEEMDWRWDLVTRKYGERTILIDHFAHNDPETFGIHLYPHFGMGITSSGQLKRERRIGSPNAPNQRWWHDF